LLIASLFPFLVYNENRKYIKRAEVLRDWPKTLPATSDTTHGANSSPRRGRCLTNLNKPSFKGWFVLFRKEIQCVGQFMRSLPISKKAKEKAD
jgi:hypothetical protein